MKEDKKNEIIYFIEEKVGIEINDNTIFFDDLEITGLDAYLLMEDIAIQFKVDMQSYVPDKYHLSENDIFNIPKTIFKGLFNKGASNIQCFNLQHLLKVIDKGIWFDPI